MENNLEIIVFILFDKLPGTLPKNNDEIGLSISKLREGFLNCLTSFNWTLPKNNDGCGLPISKLRENTLGSSFNDMPRAAMVLTWK